VGVLIRPSASLRANRRSIQRNPNREKEMTEQGPSFEERTRLHDLLREDAHRAHDNSSAFHTYVNQATIESANIALKTLIVINGGAAIAVLTFLGGVASKDKIDFASVAAVAYTIRYFTFGVALTLAAMAFSYLTNYFMAGIEMSRLRTFTHPYVSEGPQQRTRGGGIEFFIFYRSVLPQPL